MMLKTVLIVGLVGGCGKSFKGDAESAKGSVRVQIITPGSVGASTSDKLPYSLSVVELTNIYDLVSVSGKYAQFFTKASRSDDKIYGAQPQGRYLKSKDGIFYPRNYLSLQIATLYFHTQNLFQLEQSLNLKDARKVPLKIVLDTPILNAKQSENNAFYEGSLDAIIYLKYSEGELPLSLNGGVFAHEYFHSIFDRTVLKKLKTIELFNTPVLINKAHANKAEFDVEKIDLKETSQLIQKKIAGGSFVLSTDDVKWYYALLLKGINEGIADFWGWSYVNDISFISHSLPQTRMTRKLDLQSQKLNSLQLLSDTEMLSIAYQASDSKFETQAQKLDLINAFSYMLGSRLALFFKSYSETIQKERNLSAAETKKIMFQYVIGFTLSLTEILPQAKPSADTTQLINAYSLIYSYFSKQNQFNKNECDFLKTFLENDSKLAATIDCVGTAEKFKLTTKVTE